MLHIYKYMYISVYICTVLLGVTEERCEHILYLLILIAVQLQNVFVRFWSADLTQVLDISSGTIVD